MAEEHRPPWGCAPLTAARRRQDRQPRCERGLSDDEIAGGDGPDAFPSSGHRRALSRGLEGGRARRMQEEQGMTTTREIDPFLKGDFPLAPRSVTGKVSLSVHRGSRPMTRGPGPTRHIGWPEARRRQTTTQGARNRPMVIRPFIFRATSSQEGEPPHKERATAPRLCSLHFRQNQRSGKRTATKEANKLPRGCALP
jgi:hypothetical protein